MGCGVPSLPFLGFEPFFLPLTSRSIFRQLFFRANSSHSSSVSGMATLSRDKDVIRELYAPDWKAWFARNDDPRAGTPEDPAIVLIGVDVVSAVYFEVDKPQPVVLYELAKAWMKGDPPDIGEVHRVG